MQESTRMHTHTRMRIAFFLLSSMVACGEPPSEQALHLAQNEPKPLEAPATNSAPREGATSATFVVINTNDSGAGSLRQAILDANANLTTDTINFNIPGTGVKIIQPSTALPTLTGKVTLDGCTQTGANCQTWPPRIQVELDFSVAGRGLTVLGGGSLVRGLSLGGATYTPTLDPGEGISFRTRGGNKLQTCFLGVRSDGVTAFQNGYGVLIADASNLNIIGSELDGTNDANERNLISGNLTGVQIEGSGGSNQLVRNWIGVDQSGSTALPNKLGGVVVENDAGNNLYKDNVVSGNATAGIWLRFVSNETLTSNFIGVDARGLTALGNNGPGLRLEDTNRVVIGGSLLTGNRIANNLGAGIQLDEGSGLGNRYSYNSIQNNKGLGIDLLLPVGANPHDADDADTGVNDLLNAPELGPVVLSDQVTINYRVMSDPVQVVFPLTIDFYLADSDNEEPKTWLGSDTYLDNEAEQLTTFTFTPATSVTTGARIVAIATDRNGNASEASPKDADGDGATWPSDCHDANPAIKPGATELAGDGIDQNCDGRETCYKDADGDGYRPDTTSTVVSNDATCTDLGEASASAPTTDCNDSSKTAYPGATESCDQEDSDCDGSLVDSFPDSDNDSFPDCIDTDDDADGKPDGSDNCPLVPNPSQTDTDGNGKGDACEQDGDGDLYGDAVDNCPTIKNADQADLDKDGLGDACDTDKDGDGLASPADCNDTQASLTTLKRYYRDADGDNFGDSNDFSDVCSNSPPTGYVSRGGDNCPQVSNPDQADADQDGLGDVCDTDKDGDGVSASQDCNDADANISALYRYYRDADGDGLGDSNDFQDLCTRTTPSGYVTVGGDNCPLASNSSQADLDLDGQGDACDEDKDGDGTLNTSDCAPNDENLSSLLTCYADADEDGFGTTQSSLCTSACPSMTSSQGGDNCPTLSNPSQADLDQDTQGDACDSDADGDGASKTQDCNDQDAAVSTLLTGYQDDDGDGIGNGPAQMFCAATLPEGYVSTDGDNCPKQANASQSDEDGDGLGDACDAPGETPTPTSTPEQNTPTPELEATATPALEPTPTPTGEETPTLQPEQTPSATPETETPSLTPSATATPGGDTSTPSPTPEETPKAVDLVGGGCICAQHDQTRGESWGSLLVGLWTLLHWRRRTRR